MCRLYGQVLLNTTEELCASGEALPTLFARKDKQPMIRAHTRTKLAGITLAAAAAVALSFSPLPPHTGTEAQSPPYLATHLSSPDPLTARLKQSLALGPTDAEAAPVPTGSNNSVYFRQTGHYLRDAFLNYWLMNGGVGVYGYPVSEEFVDNGVPVQYFERSRFEYRPNSSRAWKVELSPVGTIITAGRAFPPATDATSTDGRTYFPETGHSISGAFLDFWQS